MNEEKIKLQKLDQDFFDKTIKHFVKQGHPAVQGTSCRYRNNKGDRCAIGCHIPKKVYKSRMDNGFGVTSLLRDFPIVAQYLQADTELMQDLQSVHDNLGNWEQPNKMICRLYATVQKHNLDPATLFKLDFSKIRNI